MTYIKLTCDNCGEYGDIICENCNKRGLREYCFCDTCIEEHLEADNDREETWREMEEDKQARREKATDPAKEGAQHEPTQVHCAR